jgi:hypothetical protein
VSNSTGGGGREHARRQHYARYEDEISPEEIFNMFFGGGFPAGGGIRMRGGFHRGPEQHFRQQQYANERQQQGGGARYVQLLQLLPLLLLFLFSVLSFRSVDEKQFSLSRNDAFRLERKTSLYGVTSGLPYYVKDEFWSRVTADRSLLSRVRALAKGGTESGLQGVTGSECAFSPVISLPVQVERAVESELYSTYSQACSAETQRRSVIENQLKYASSAARERLKARLEEARTPNCDAFTKYFGSG